MSMLSEDDEIYPSYMMRPGTPATGGITSSAESDSDLAERLQHACNKQKIFDSKIVYTYKGSRIEIRPLVRPFQVLGLPKTSTLAEARYKFKSLISATTSRQERALISIAYSMTGAFITKKLPAYLREVDISIPSYSFDAASSIVWVIVGYCAGLRTQSESNHIMKKGKSLSDESLLYLAIRSGFEDVVELLFEMGCVINSKGNGSTALHAAAFFLQTPLISYLIQRGADVALKNRFDSTAVEEAAENMRSRMLTEAQNTIPTFIRKVLAKEKMGEVQHIRDGGKVVAYRMVRDIGEDMHIKLDTNWYPAWHGTKAEHVESIVEYGLKKPGEKAGKHTISPPAGHIRPGVHMRGKSDYGGAIFVSQAVKYACHPAYAERIRSTGVGAEPFCVLVETAVKPGSYEIFKETVGGYTPRKGDFGGDEEMRVVVGGHSSSGSSVGTGGVDPRRFNPGDEENVVVTAVVLVSDNFMNSTVMLQDQLHSFLRGYRYY